MKRIVRLTESDLTRIVRRVINEQASPATYPDILISEETMNKGRNLSMKYLEGSSILAVKSVTFGTKDAKGNTPLTASGDKFVVDANGAWTKAGSNTWTVFTTGRSRPNGFFNANGDVYVSKVGGLLATQVKTKFPMTQGAESFSVPGLQV
jgi:hypothetical protein